jgi:hypothetical protein
LIYPIQFDADPLLSVDRVMECVVARSALGGSPAMYLHAVRKALASQDRIATLIPQDHPESVIRGFLAEVERRLIATTSKNAD